MPYEHELTGSANVSARILIIEDNPTNMELMVYLLNAFGYTPLTAHDGEAGVATARRERPDLIICDVHLPKLDGYGVVAQLKQDPALRPIPALAVTALAMVGDRERLLAAGFDGYIGKPIEPDTFVAQIESFLPGEVSPPAKNDIATILIVDDHVLNREFLMTLLGYGGHRLLEASNGAEGLKMVSAERPDLVISDILMPNMDGYEFVTRMHSNPETAHVPIIFYTATYREREAMAVAEACGVRWVLPKPSDPDVILRTVREALGVTEDAEDTVPAFAPEPPSGGRFLGIDHKVAEYLGELESSSALISQIASTGDVPPTGAEHLTSMTERLSRSLSSLQAVSLRLTALIELGIELGAERDPQALIEVGCRVAQNICVSKYACIGVLEAGAEELSHFAACGVGQQARLIASTPRAGVLGGLLEQRLPMRIDALAGDPTAIGLPDSHPPVHSFLGVPIASRERTHGWLYLVDKLGADSFSEVDERVAATVAAQISVAYENLLLYDEIRRHHAQLQLDMNARIRLDEDLRRFRLAMDATADAIFLLDAATAELVDVNDGACRMLGYPRDEMLGQTASRLGLGTQALLRAQALRLEDYAAAIGQPRTPELAELELMRRDLVSVPVEIYWQLLTRPGQSNVMLGVARDISERRHSEELLQHMAHYDSLTGLPNRTLFFQTLADAIALAQEKSWRIVVLFIALDRFKNINDSLGAALGDELLRQFSNRLVQCVRLRDTVGRMGGDEFALILSMPRDQQDAVHTANEVREALRLPFDLNGHPAVLSASIGIAMYPDDATDPETLLKYADTAMERAKQAGRDGYRFFTAGMNVQVLARLDMELALRRALDNDELLLYYQPKVNLHTGAIAGAEALLRWQRPGFGLVFPSEFVPVLEDTGLIVRVGAWIIDAACKQIGAWLRSGVGAVRVAVNVASRQFIEGDLEQVVRSALVRHEVPPELLELELTETALMSNAERTIMVLTNLKAIGIKVAIDDFGTGYSSLAYLQRFPIDKLKIDIAFVREITTCLLYTSPSPRDGLLSRMPSSA